MDASKTTLQHYGVKGMKWGVRRDRSPTDVVTKAAPGKRVQATGGKNQPASEDATKAAVARQKAKASTVDALSNRELQELVTRMNLEQQYARLSKNNVSAGRKLVNSFLKDYGKNKFVQYADEAVQDRPELGPIVSGLKAAMNSGGGKKNKK